MAYKFFVGGVEVHADSLDDLLTAVKGGVTSPTATPSRPAKKQKKGKQGSGPKAEWKKSHDLAKKLGIPPSAARALRRQRKDEIEKMLENINELLIEEHSHHHHA